MSDIDIEASTISVPKSALALELTSPSFEMQYPHLSHRDKIPNDILWAMEASWKARLFPERPITMSVLHDVYVVEEGLVFDSSGRLYEDSITQHGPLEIQRGRAAVQAAILSGSLPPLRGQTVLCKKRGSQNYGHWLIEMLPSVYLAKMFFGQDVLRYLVPAATGPLETAIAQSLSMLNIDAACVAPVGTNPLRLESLLLIKGLSYHGVYLSPLVIDCMGILSARVRGHPPKKLLVTRNSSTARRFVNEDQVHSLAMERGYTLIDPGEMSLTEQIATFKNASEIVGVMGAAMTNIAFAPRSARIVNLAPAGMPDTFFWFIAGIKGQNYHEIRCEQAGPIRGVAPWDTDIIFPLEDLNYAFPQ